MSDKRSGGGEESCSPTNPDSTYPAQMEEPGCFGEEVNVMPCAVSWKRITISRRIGGAQGRNSSNASDGTAYH